MSKIKDTDYLYISALIRAKENRLLTPEQAGRMIDSKTDGEAVKILEECGYGDLAGLDAVSLEGHLTERQKSIFGEIYNLCPDPLIVDIFRMKYDYHNVKVLIKAQAVGADGGRLMSWNGRIAPEVLEEAYYKDSLSELPGILGGAIPEARDVLARTKDAQMADIVLDKAFFQELLGALEQIGSDFITAYGKLSIDAANLRTAARASRMDMDHGMLPDILIPGGDVEIAALAAAARQAESLAALYAAGPLADAAIAGDSAIDGGSLTAFEKRCDDTVTAYLRAAKRISFGEAPVVAYLHAMEAEIGTVRIIMNGRSASLPAIKIRERLRDSYV